MSELDGTWRVPPTELKTLRLLMQAKGRLQPGHPDLQKLQQMLAHWESLCLDIRGDTMVGDIGDGRSERTFRVVDRKTSSDREKVFLLELLDQAGAAQERCSITFLDQRRAILERQDSRVPLDRQ